MAIVAGRVPLPVEHAAGAATLVRRARTILAAAARATMHLRRRRLVPCYSCRHGAVASLGTETRPGSACAGAGADRLASRVEFTEHGPPCQQVRVGEGSNAGNRCPAHGSVRA